MPSSSLCRRRRRGPALPHGRRLLGFTLLAAGSLLAQTPAPPPSQTPSAQASTTPAPTSSTPAPSTISPRQAREADSAYIQGAREVDRKDFAAAEASFARAVQLNPRNRDYVLALAVTREHRLSALVQSAAKARLLGDTARADTLLQQARALDPNSAVIAQHFAGPSSLPSPTQPLSNPVAATLADAIELAPSPTPQDIHLRGSAQNILRSLYSLFGIATTFDAPLPGASSLRLDLDAASFADATRVAAKLTHTFAVPLQPHTALIAPDTQDNRDRLQPQIEETVYMPGIPTESMTEMANLARNIFDLKSVTAGNASGSLVLRGDRQSLNVLNATYADMLTGGSDVLLDVNLYEIDRSNTRNIGLQLPSSAGIFSITAEAQQLVSANQTVINQAIAAGLIKTTGNSLTDLITEVGFLIASGTVSVSQYTNLLGIFGNGLSLAGLYVGSGSTINLLLNSSDVRILDAVQIRSGDRQAATFRAGSRYPITTSTYTTGGASALAAAAAGLNIGGSSVSSLLQQYLGSSSVTVPQIQFEDLGLTLKTTPQVLHGGSVKLQLDFKIESLGATSLNGIPVLNSRQLTSGITIPAGETALIVSQVSSSESRTIQGIPGLGDLPGFGGTTNSNVVKDVGELLITITPHIVREGNLRIASRALSVPHSNTPGMGPVPEQQLQPPPPAPGTPPPPGTPGAPQPPGTPAPGTAPTTPIGTPVNPGATPLNPSPTTPAPGTSPQP